MLNDEISNTNQKEKPWYASSGLALCSVFASFIIWIVISCMTAGDFEIKPTQMILKADGCSYLRQIGISTINSENGINCTVNVPYRSNTFGNGGVIVLDDDRQIKITDTQVVIVGSIENPRWTQSQKHSAMLMAASSIFMVGMMVWFFRLIFTSKS